MRQKENWSTEGDWIEMDMARRCIGCDAKLEDENDNALCKGCDDQLKQALAEEQPDTATYPYHNWMNCPLYDPQRNTICDTCRADKFADEADQKYDLLRGN